MGKNLETLSSLATAIQNLGKRTVLVVVACLLIIAAVFVLLSHNNDPTTPPQQPVTQTPAEVVPITPDPDVFVPPMRTGVEKVDKPKCDLAIVAVRRLTLGSGATLSTPEKIQVLGEQLTIIGTVCTPKVASQINNNLVVPFFNR